MSHEVNFESVLSGKYKKLEDGEEKLSGNIKEEIFLPEIGTRHLTDDQISSLGCNLNYIFNGILDFDTIDKVAKKVAGLLIENDINFESAWNLWIYLQGNVDVLKEVYSKPQENQINLSFSEILFENGGNSFILKLLTKLKLM